MMKCLKKNTGKFSKFSDTLIVMLQKDAHKTVSSDDPVQTAQIQAHKMSYYPGCICIQ